MRHSVYSHIFITYFSGSDISRGRESNPVQCVNTVDGDPEPNDFVYMTKNCLTVDNLKIDRNLSRMSSCACTDNCKTDSCSCTSRSRKCWYDEEDRLAKDFNFDGKFITTL